MKKALVCACLAFGLCLAGCARENPAGGDTLEQAWNQVSSTSSASARELTQGEVRSFIFQLQTLFQMQNEIIQQKELRLADVEEVKAVLDKCGVYTYACAEGPLLDGWVASYSACYDLYLQNGTIKALRDAAAQSVQAWQTLPEEQQARFHAYAPDDWEPLAQSYFTLGGSNE